jgi:hypothetical protein
MTIELRDVEEFVANFNAKNYARDELLKVVGMALCLRSESYNELDARKARK